MIHVNGKDYLFAKCTGYVCRLMFVPPSDHPVKQRVRVVKDVRVKFGQDLFLSSFCGAFLSYITTWFQEISTATTFHFSCILNYEQSL